LKRFATIFILLMLSLGANAQKFNEDSLYAAITSMGDSDTKLARMLEYSTNANDITKVKKVALDAVGLAIKLNDYESEAKAYGILGWAYCMRDAEFGRARNFWFKALEINDSLGISYDKIKNQINIASSLFNENRLGSGLKYLEFAENEVEKTGTAGLSKNILSLKGWAYSRLQIFDEAQKEYRKMAEICQADGDSAMMYQAYYGIAANYLRKSVRTKEKAYVDTAITLAEEVLRYYDGQTHIWMQMYQMFPLIYLESAKNSSDKNFRKKQLEIADQLCEKGLRLADSTKMNMYKDNIRAAKTELLIYEGRLREAKMLLDILPGNVTQDAKLHYLKAVGDYKTLMAEMDRQAIATNRDAAMQSMETIMQSDDQQAYEVKRMELDNKSQERQKIQKRKKLIFKILRHTMYAVIILVLAIASVLAVFWIIFWRHNKIMSGQNQTLYTQTHQLENLVEEEDAQNSEIMQQSQILLDQNKELEFQLQCLTDGIQYAKHIQDAVIPSREMMKSMFGNCLIYYRPLDIVSGDFYWAVQVNNVRLLAVCDCTGHSVPGALLSILGISFLNDIISYRTYKSPDAAAILNSLRSMIVKGIGSECDDGMDMALMIHNRDTQKIHYAGAMRPLYLMRDGEIKVYKANRMPIGRYVLKEKPFTEHLIDAMPNDRLYMFSDGMTDVFNEDRSEKYSEKEFREMLAGFNGMDFATQKEYLEKFYDSWGSRAIIDDQLLIGIEIG